MLNQVYNHIVNLSQAQPLLFWGGIVVILVLCTIILMVDMTPQQRRDTALFNMLNKMDADYNNSHWGY